MAYKKYTKKTGRKIYRKRTYKKKEPVAKLALRLLETKKNETRGVEVNVNSLNGWYFDAGHMVLSQGDSYNQLEGHMVRGRGISVRGFIKNNATTTQIVRLGLICVKQGSGNVSNASAGIDILEGNTSNQNITTANSVQRMTQRFNQDQYKAIKSLFFKLAPNNSSDGADVKTFKMWIPLKGATFRYDGSGIFPLRNVYGLYCCNVLANNDESIGENVELSYTTTFYYVDV